MKRIICLILVSVFLLSAAFGASALHDGALTPELDRVLDGADLLSDSEEKSLERKISRLGEEWGFDVLIITVDSDVGDIEPYSEDIYDIHGYGYGENADGILLIVSMYSREWLISACGSGEFAFTDYGRDTIGEIIAGYFSEEEYDGGFSKFVTLTEKFLTKAEKGQPYDYNEKFLRPIDFLARILIGVVVGCIVGGIVVMVQKGSMKTVVAQRNASNYMVPGSLVMNTGKDLFITSIVTKTPKAPPPSQGSKGGRAGGSTSHMSSSGRSHSSSRGKF